MTSNILIFGIVTVNRKIEVLTPNMCTDRYTRPGIFCVYNLISHPEIIQTV